MKLTLMKRIKETADVESFYWQPIGEDQPELIKLDYKPGQYLKWTIDDNNPDDRGNSRFFSISSSPTEALVSLTTKFNATRSSTFKTTLKKLMIGDSIGGFGPIGSFVLPEEPKLPLVFIAGGIGITPFRSMLKFMADTGANHPVHLLYACRTPADIAFRELLDEIEQVHEWLKITYVVETSEESWEGEVGRLDAARILSLAGGLNDKQAYLSGPEPMIKGLKDALLDAGVKEDNLMTDYFPNYV